MRKSNQDCIYNGFKILWRVKVGTTCVVFHFVFCFWTNRRKNELTRLLISLSLSVRINKRSYTSYRSMKILSFVFLAFQRSWRLLSNTNENLRLVCFCFYFTFLLRVWLKRWRWDRIDMRLCRLCFWQLGWSLKTEVNESSYGIWLWSKSLIFIFFCFRFRTVSMQKDCDNLSKKISITRGDFDNMISITWFR